MLTKTTKTNRLLATVLVLLIVCLSCIFLLGDRLTAYAAGADQIEFDEYTNSKSLYSPDAGQAGMTIYDYKGMLYTAGMTTVSNFGGLVATVTKDDPIVKIVPRILFQQNGTKLHIGREYGFFITTEAISSYATESTVFVFDIKKYPLSSSNFSSQYVIEIAPLFQYKYYYLRQDNDFNTNNYKFVVNSPLSSVVVAAPDMLSNFQETEEYFLKDISFGLSVFNEQELNIGDTGYNKYQDNGSFITRTGINFSGVANQGLFGEIDVLSTANFVFGFFKKYEKLNKALSILDYSLSMIVNLIEPPKTTVEYGDFYSTAYHNSKIEQLQNYENLTKSAVAELLSEDQKPLLFGRTQSNDYIRCSFTLGTTEDWYTRVVDTIKLSVVTETTLFGNSTITSRTTAERSTTTSVRNIQTTPLAIDTAKSFYMLPYGAAKFSFNISVASDYKITVSNSNQMNIKVDGVAKHLSGGSADLPLSSGEHVIDIEGLNTDVLISDIAISPNLMTGSTKQINLKGNESYLLKATSLFSVKTLTTGNNSVVIQAIYQNKDLNNLYNNYGAISPASSLTHPFVAGDYYIVLKNNSPSSVTINFAVGEPPILLPDSPLIVKMNPNNYTYVKFTADTTGTYAISVSNMSNLFFAVFNSNLLSVSGVNFPGSFYTIGINAEQTYYIGINNGQSVDNTLTISKTDSAYKWQITGGSIDTTISENSTLELARGATYTLTLRVNGVAVDNAIFGYDYQSLYTASHPKKHSDNYCGRL